MIAAEVRAGRCSCEVKNRSGRCCLGDVYRAVNDAMAVRAPGSAAGSGSGSGPPGAPWPPGGAVP